MSTFLNLVEAAVEKANKMPPKPGFITDIHPQGLVIHVRLKHLGQFNALVSIFPQKPIYYGYCPRHCDNEPCLEFLYREE